MAVNHGAEEPGVIWALLLAGQCDWDVNSADFLSKRKYDAMFHSPSFYWSVELLVHFLDGKARIPTGLHSLSGCLKDKIFAVNPW